MRLVACVFAFTVIWATSAIAQLSQWEICAANGDDISLDQQIAACTAIINAGSERPVNLSRVYYNRGSTYDDQKKYDLAIHDYNEAIRIYPKDPSYFINRGVVYGGLGETDKAIKDYDQAIRLDPTNANAYYNRGNIKIDKGDQAGGDADLASARLYGHKD